MKKLKKPFKNDNYALSIRASFVISVVLFPVSIALGDINLGALHDVWLLGAESILLMSQTISGNGYLAQGIDKLTNNNTLFNVFKIKKLTLTVAEVLQLHFKNRWKALKEDYTFIGLSLGLVTAVVVSILKCVGNALFPFSGIFNFMSEMMVFIANLSLFGGLGNRLGRACKNLTDKGNTNKLRSKDINYSLSIVGGVVVGAALVGLILGFSLVTGGIPFLILFGIGLISSAASAAGYVGRIFDFFCGERTVFGMIKDSRRHEKNLCSSLSLRTNKESVLTTVGVVLGISLAVILICAGVLALPFFGVGLPKLIAGICLLTTCISALGGLGNRIGYALDQEQNAASQGDEEKQPLLQEKPPNTSELTFKTELSAYIQKREQEQSAHTGFVFFKKHFSAFDAVLKLSSADKVLKILQGDKVSLTPREKAALHEGRLGKIMEKYKNILGDNLIAEPRPSDVVSFTCNPVSSLS